MTHLLDEGGKHHILGIELGGFGTHDIPGQAKGLRQMSPMSHRFQQIEGHAVLGIFAGQVAVQAECFAEARHADPDFMRGPFVAPRVMKHRIRGSDRFATQDAIGGRQLAIAQRRQHERQFARGDGPGGGRQTNLFGAFGREKPDRTGQQFAFFLSQGEPGPRFVRDGLKTFFQRLEIIRCHGDGQLNQMQGIPVVDLLQGTAAVRNALHRPAVFTAHARQMHIVGLNDAFERINRIVPLIGLSDIH